MNNSLFEENGHITKKSLIGLKDGSLSVNELISISEHIGSCEGCANALVDSFKDFELVNAPLGFEEELQNKINKKKDSNKEVLFYSFRVAMAASIALMFVFSNAFSFLGDLKLKTLDVNPISLSSINTINKSINDFSEKIINMEVFNNEKRKK